MGLLVRQLSAWLLFRLVRRSDVFIFTLLFVIYLKAEVIPVEKIEAIRQGWQSDGFHKDHCKSSEEYIKTLEFLRKENSVPENDMRQVAHRVAKGCNGSAERFSRVYLVMRKSGVSLQKSVEVGLALVSEDPLTVNNFHEIFQKMYLNEHFNINFKSSFEIAYELSKKFQGNLDKVREDFTEFYKFCADHKSLNLSITQCSELAVRFARLSQYYPKGIFKDFKQIYETLRDDKRFGVSLKESLELAEKILKNGPTAKVNFLQAYNYASMKSGLDLPGREALIFGLQMTQLSFVGEKPPVYPGEQLLRKSSAFAGKHESGKHESVQKQESISR